MHVYSHPRRDNEYNEHALPDTEIFQVPHDYELEHEETGKPLDPGWYWWSCFPGCLPDSDAFGPFETYNDAVADATKNDEDFSILENIIDFLSSVIRDMTFEELDNPLL